MKTSKSLRSEVERLTRERDEARADVKALKFENNNLALTVKALTPAANYCLEYKPLLLAAESERDRFRTALAGLVGESDPETLRTMAALLRVAGRITEADACAALAGGGE